MASPREYNINIIIFIQKNISNIHFLGGTSPFKAPPLSIPSLAVPPVPPEVATLGSILPPSLALGISASNTCAKCGVTFRMTSDLVYHMRTHHAKLGTTR